MDLDKSGNACVRNGKRCAHRRPLAAKNLSTMACHYLLDTGQKRNCPAEGCIHYTTDRRTMREKSVVPREFSARLAHLRKTKFMSQKAFAESIGARQGMISKWESGDVVPTFEYLMRICKKHRISSDWLLGFSDIERRI